ncbi:MULTISPECIES: hypothetical protein [unclassified Streptomyces]|jgi:hypothetical protein|uniref:hypothetical protein n=1 Tax=unclassified Streptomyces TaxID=2593676 RepID=UPI001EB8A1D3|nr:hypothetical protein [Streptomyces sp.]
MKRLLSTSIATLALAAGLVISTSSPAAAESSPSCGSVVQIGDTAYIKAGGQTAVSVKQFKGCGKNWAYAYLWQSFRDTHSSWRIGAGVQTSSRVLGFNLSTGNEVWSDGTNTLDVCTQAYGVLTWNGSDYEGWTDTRC